jgi:hypothetical protein
MAHYTSVKLSNGGRQIAQATKAELCLPTAAHRYIVTGVTWSATGRTPWLAYLQQQCTMNAVGPGGTAFQATLRIGGVMADGKTVHLD